MKEEQGNGEAKGAGIQRPSRFRSRLGQVIPGRARLQIASRLT